MAPAHHPRRARPGLLTAIATDAAPKRPTDPHRPARSSEPIPLTVPEICHLLAAAFDPPALTAARLLHWSTWRRQHQATARHRHSAASPPSASRCASARPASSRARTAPAPPAGSAGSCSASPGPSRTHRSRPPAPARGRTPCPSFASADGAAATAPRTASPSAPQAWPPAVPGAPGPRGPRPARQWVRGRWYTSNLKGRRRYNPSGARPAFTGDGRLAGRPGHRGGDRRRLGRRHAGTGDRLRPGVRRRRTAGHVPETMVDDAVRRVLRLAARAGLLGGAEPAVPADALPAPVDGGRLAKEIAARSFVLLRNPDSVLPLAPAAGGRRPDRAHRRCGQGCADPGRRLGHRPLRPCRQPRRRSRHRTARREGADVRGRRGTPRGPDARRRRLRAARRAACRGQPSCTSSTAGG